MTKYNISDWLYQLDATNAIIVSSQGHGALSAATASTEVSFFIIQAYLQIANAQLACMHTYITCIHTFMVSINAQLLFYLGQKCPKRVSDR